MVGYKANISIAKPNSEIIDIMLVLEKSFWPLIMKQPLFFQRAKLSHKAVMIQCLDKYNKPIEHAYASGFILKEIDGLYLYTSWHVVAGVDMHNLPATPKLERVVLRISMIKSHEQEPSGGLSACVLNGLESLDLPLYENENTTLPLWCQDPIYEFNNEVITVPDKHDAVKIKLPDSFHTSDIHIIEQDELNKDLVFTGDRVYIVGYPYQFSTRGENNPTPVVLTKFIASTSIKSRLFEFLIDGQGAPGMSGGPVFLERDNQIFLLGIYSGLIYTSGHENRNKEVGALSTCVNMSLCWAHDIAALRRPRTS